MGKDWTKDRSKVCLNNTAALHSLLECGKEERVKREKAWVAMN